MKIDVKTLDDGASGSVDLPDHIFGIKDVRSDLLHRMVRYQLAKRRAGTHAATAVTINVTNAAPAKTSGLCGATVVKVLCNHGVVIHAQGRPNTSPRSPTPRACLRIMDRSADGDPPSADRRPISRVRLATPAARTPPNPIATSTTARPPKYMPPRANIRSRTRD